ncbi:MAG: response regulator transcription factor [Chloroflexi bacterium]|nr:response regulator transcription factor [Chloroflexota bacterium]
MARTLTSILVIEDEPAIASALQIGLSYEGFRVEMAGDGDGGLDLAQQRQPDLVILDVNLPGMDGWEVCRRIRSYSSVPIIFLTVRDEVSDRVRGLNLGADDYIVKPFNFQELLARVRAVLRRHGQGLEGKLLSFEDVMLRLDTREVTRGGAPVELTARHFDLLHLFMLHPREVLAKDRILREVWGYDYEGDSNIVEVYMMQLRRRLGDPPLIQTLRGAGYALRLRP